MRRGTSSAADPKRSADDRDNRSVDTGQALQSIDTLEERLGLVFRDRALIQRALTHRSYLNEVVDPEIEDNERLEFLGDALLGFAVAQDLYTRMPDAPEGELTALRAALVRASALADFARTLQLGDHLRMGRGEATSGGREREGLLCDAFEAMLGAVLIEHGTEVARRLALDFVRPELEDVVAKRRAKDAKSALQEHAQGRWRITPVYETIAESGPDHDKRFVVRVLVGQDELAIGRGTSKSLAERSAAARALEALAERERIHESEEAEARGDRPIRVQEDR